MDNFSLLGPGADYTKTISNLTNGQSLENRLSKVETEDDGKMMEACKEFEAYMLEQVYKQMQKTVMKEEQDNQYLSYFGDMQIQQYAKTASDQGTIGLAQQLYASMKRQASGLSPEEVNALEEAKRAAAEAAKQTEAEEAEEAAAAAAQNEGTTAAAAASEAAQPAMFHIE